MRHFVRLKRLVGRLNAGAHIVRIAGIQVDVLS
jgi:hypothetical protein